MTKPISRERIIKDVDAFCEKYGMRPTEFGLKALKDGSFYGRLKDENRSPTLERIEAIYDFMAEYESDEEPTEGDVDGICA